MKVRFAAVVVLVCAVASSCEDSFADAPQSWECLRVRTLVDLTSSMPVAEARTLLDGLVDDTDLTDDERVYATALRSALDDRDPQSELGDALDVVPCTLGTPAA